MKRRNFVILAAIVLGMLVAAPVSAYYSISVTAGAPDSGNLMSPTVKSLLSQYQSPRSLFGTSSSDLAANAMKNAAQPSKGSVSAYSSGISENQYSKVNFNNRVSVDGLIYNFNYEARFDSSMFR